MKALVWVMILVILDSCCFAGSVDVDLAANNINGYNPSANPKSVVSHGKARFTVLTENLIRMEYDAHGEVTDAATFAFVNRNLPTPVFKVTQQDKTIIIQTSALKVVYMDSLNTTFSKNNLNVSVQVGSTEVVWSPKTIQEESLGGNLMGTLRTLDGELGERQLDCYKQPDPQFHCTLGLVSRDGYVVVDDTHRPQFDHSSWAWVVNRSYPAPQLKDCSAVPTDQRQSCGILGISEFDCTGMGCCYDVSVKDGHSCYHSMTGSRDLYFFGHGHDYKQALKEFTMVSGNIPMPPRYAFGIFYSRYWAYNDIGEMRIVKEYEQHQIPLDVLVTDMDWHITFYSQASQGKKDQAGGTLGWTGFTWDSHLFPNAKAFLSWCKVKGLKNTLNLHPFSGIQPWEEKYSEMAKAMGIDPTTSKYVPFDPANKTFVSNWMTIVLGEREDEGIDFWWLDWQQGENFVKIPSVNPTFLLNYIFFTNPYHWKNNTVRPFLLHRWGGLGNHRYQVGFSGDVVPAWQSLDYQVSFTLAATNVGYGYWSHDLGGHIKPSPPELYTRWVQWGTFSPMFRTHCTKNADNYRRIWVYPPENYEILRQSMVLRAALVPYIYTHARLAYEEGLSLLRAMYYEFPEEDNAYTFNKQYYFGLSMIVSPITEPMDNTSLVTKKIWIPQGTYISWVSGEMVKGDTVLTRTFTLSETPVWVKAGSIIPMRTDDTGSLGTAQEIPMKLKLLVFVGDQPKGQFSLYEDDGRTTEYINEAYVNTVFSYVHDVTLSSLSFTVNPVEIGKYKGQPSKRSYQIVLPNFWPADDVSLEGGSKLPYVQLRDTFDTYSENSWTYDGSTLSLILNIVVAQPVDKQFVVTAFYTSFKNFNINFFPGFSGMLVRLQQMKELLDDQWGIDTVFQDQYPNFLFAVEIGQMITYDPRNILTIAPKFSNFFSNGIKEISDLKNLNKSVLATILAVLKR